MYLRMLIFLSVFLLLASTASADIFYKDNPSVQAGADQQSVAQVNCEGASSQGCRGTTKPTRFSAFGDCKVITSTNGRPLFIPARSKKEWGNFMGWAQQHPQIVSVDSCTDPLWSAWGQCSTRCGTGVRTRRCSVPTMSEGKTVCKGPSEVECSDFSGCACGKLEKRTVFCEGQDRKFTAPPPEVTYVDFDQCDHVTKCQARCPQNRPALPDKSGCSDG